MKKKKGFTFIELITIIAILGIIAAIIIPNTSEYIKKAKIAKIKINAKLCLDVINITHTENDEDIDTYEDAVTERPDLKLSKKPTKLKDKTMDELQEIIDKSSSSFSNKNIDDWLD